MGIIPIIGYPDFERLLLCALCFNFFYYLESLLGVTLEYHLNSLCLMYQQHTTPVLIWNNLILDLRETSRFHVSLKSNHSSQSDKHYCNDIEGWPLRIIKISLYFIILFHFMISILFVVYLNKLRFFQLNYE